MKEKYNLSSCIEIGPGKGAITKLIQPIFNDTFRAIEKDTTFEPILQELIPENQLIFNDVLQVDLNSLPVQLDSTLIYGSLPYYITSPIIGKVFLPPESKQEASGQQLAASNIETSKHRSIEAGIFIVQKEFAEKIEVNAKKKSYLWRLLNHGHIVTYHKTIPAKGFSPAPKVDSAIISIIKNTDQEVDYHKMLIILDKISGFKRKTIGKIIKMLQGSQVNVLPRAKQYPIPDGARNDNIEASQHRSIAAFSGKRLEELSRNEMKILVDYLHNQHSNESSPVS